MFNTFKKIRFLNQTGRSMLEITCVLAIIGVLGIASYLGIRTGLSKTQVSKIAYTINLQANALLMTLEAENAPINEDNDLILTYNKTENGYALTGFSNDEESFAITVHGVPKDICQQAGNIMPEAAFGMVINAEDEDNQIPAGGQAKVGGVCIDDQNTLTYHFAAFGISKEDALSDYLCDEIDPSCGRCEECHNGQCELVPAGTPDPICEDEDPEKPFCSATGTCVCSSGSCGEDKACNINTGACINCPTGDSSVQL